MSQQVLESLNISNTADGGSYDVTHQAEIITSPEMPDNEETVSVAEGFDVRRGYRKEVSAMILDPDAFAGTGGNDSMIDDLMEARADVVLTFNWKGVTETTVLNGAKLTALPVMDEVPDNVSVWYDTDTDATDNPDTDADGSWTELEEVVGETGHEADNITTPNGRGLPFWVRSMFMHPIPLFYDATAYSNIKTEENNRNEVRIAIENQAGNYRIYGGNGTGVHVRIHENPNPDPDDVGEMILTVYQSASFTDLITYPTGADDYFYGVEFTAEAFGHDEADILTENRIF